MPSRSSANSRRYDDDSSRGSSAYPNDGSFVGDGDSFEQNGGEIFRDEDFSESGMSNAGRSNSSGRGNRVGNYNKEPSVYDDTPVYASNDEASDADYDEEGRRHPAYGQDPDGRGNDYNGRNDSSVQSNEPKRPYKYSTADLSKTSNKKKYCCIALMFLGLLIFMSLLSWLLNWLVFSGETDNDGSGYNVGAMERSPNDTFALHKNEVDQLCSRGSWEVDQGEKCDEICQPQFYQCCDDLHDLNVFEFTDYYLQITNSTDPNLDPNTIKFDLGNCSISQNLAGCLRYSKCQSLTELVDPAPATLPVLCSDAGLERDRTTCEDVCSPVQCCFSEDDSCRGQNLDICMDYAPCQNLREGDRILESAPNDLDRNCMFGTIDCIQACKKAECCNLDYTDEDGNGSCFQENFLSCLTYAPCNNVTETSIAVEPLFNFLPSMPAEIMLACGEKRTDTPDTCLGYCEAAQCCYSNDPAKNCFGKDPLGCVAWNQECQHELVLKGLLEGGD